MNRQEAENYIYESYLKAQDFWDYTTPDSLKRSPAFSRKILQRLSAVPAAVITGSKGKGSVAKIISKILQSRKKVGLFTSPHISLFNERFSVNDKMISDADFVRHIKIIKPLFDEISHGMEPGKCISPIGIQTALALNYFNEEATDFNILECGKGAKYDDVPNVRHEYAVINTIFLEHTRELGHTLREIAMDKSYVMDGTQKCVVIGRQNPEVMEVLMERSHKYETPLKIFGKDYGVEKITYTQEGMIFDGWIGNDRYNDIHIPLLGEHQAVNCILAMTLCKEILGKLDSEMVNEALKDLCWPGRQQVLSSYPFILLDACINTESTINLKNTLDYLRIKDAILIVGIPDDKDFSGVVKSMHTYAKEIIITKSQNPHYVFTANQVSHLKELGMDALWIDNLEEAISRALKKGNPTVILGTTSLVSEVIDWKNRSGEL